MSIIPDGIPAVTHPDFCDPRLCTTVLDGGELLVVHRAVLLDTDDRHVEVMRADTTTLDGTVLASDPVQVGFGADDLTPDAAFALARSLAAAAAVAAGVAPRSAGGAA